LAGPRASSGDHDGGHAVAELVLVRVGGGEGGRRDGWRCGRTAAAPGGADPRRGRQPASWRRG